MIPAVAKTIIFSFVPTDTVRSNSQRRICMILSYLLDVTDEHIQLVGQFEQHRVAFQSGIVCVVSGKTFRVFCSRNSQLHVLVTVLFEGLEHFLPVPLKN